MALVIPFPEEDKRVLVQIGQVWRHYKGVRYKVKDIARGSDGNVYVVYFREGEEYLETYVRPIGEWLQTNPDHTPKFTLQN